MNKKNKIKPVVNIINPAFQSSKGKAFAGTTTPLNFGGNRSAWGRLFNPPNSKINLFLSFFSLSNFSKTPISGQLYFSSTPPGRIFSSRDVRNINLNFNNSPNGKIQFNPSVRGKPIGGNRVAFRRFPPNSTTPGFRIDGRAVVAPGTSIILFLTSSKPVKATIEFEWWESKKIFNN
ncbi:DUF6143 family protein [Chengkuizengella sediminis]|uniref:DUF6143 family protein n=1 Tax=Chengkuizengella sediminis TaxID=1885917 RepID=UPI001389EABB|nr:DUF6143 family protein [Chengkuizengella sediminis]NDI33975.1 hypothetical protein [Chengkuizengella sediminis]